MAKELDEARRVIEHLRVQRKKNTIKTPTEYKLLRRRLNAFKYRAEVNKDFTEQDVVDLYGKNPVCFYTGLPIDYNKGETYELEHFHPVSKGGTSDLENLRLSVPKVNAMKRNYLWEEFSELCRLIAEKHPKTI